VGLAQGIIVTVASDSHDEIPSDDPAAHLAGDEKAQASEHLAL
jgi:hypothetical protein